MSKKASAEMVESNFEQFAENAGWDTSELAEHVHEVFAEGSEEDLMQGVSFEDETPEESEDTSEKSEDTGVNLEDMEHGKKTKLASKGVEMGVLDEYPGNSHEALDNALRGNVTDIMGSEDTEDTKESEDTDKSEGYNVPYGNTDSPNDPESYDHPEAIMSRSDIKNHPEYDGSTDVNKLMHYQGKHGLCVECGLWAAMAGDTCHEHKGSSEGSNDEPLTAEDKALMGDLVANPDNDVNSLEEAKAEIRSL